ncbi:PucR family transcriptional regulator [Leadbettera azotonutricia]|nr:sugar diacid recognition domain-containing protein [Leadbettera azotonutricia]
MVGNSVIHVTNEEGRILASTESKRMGTKSSTAQYIIQVLRPAAIKSAEFVAYGTPIYFNKELSGCVVIRGPADSAPRQGELIRVSIESALEYEYYMRNREQNEDGTASIALMLLSDKIDAERLVPLMNKHELDNMLLRSVLCISLKFHQTSYFNINLNLGYQAGIERIRAEAVKRIKANRYLNSQDIVYVYDGNTIVIIKSFIPVSDYSRIYLSLDKICQDVARTLSEFSAFSFGISYGNVSYGINELKKSLQEAMEIISIGQRTQPKEQLFILEHILFDNICHYLYPQIVNKLIEPAISKLTKKDGSIQQDLISCAEAFVDNCMSFSRTAQNTMLHRNTINSRLAKLTSLTGLDPAHSFRDAFIIKMLATYIRQNK